MPENSVPPGNRRINVSVGKAEVSEASFSRVDIQTGDLKSAEADLLREVKEVITEEHKSLRNLLAAAHRKNTELLNSIKNTIDGVGGVGGGRGGIPPSKREPNVEDLKKLSESMNALPDELTKGLSDVMERLATRQAGKFGGEGGGEIPGREFARLQTLERVQELLNDIFKDLNEGRINVKDFFEVFSKGAIAQFKENFRSLGEAAVDAGRSLSAFADLRSQMRGATDAFKSFIEVSKTGMVDFSDFMFDDFFQGFRSGHQRMMETFDSIQRVSQQNVVTPLGFMGSNLEEVSQGIATMREGIEDAGFDALQAMDFREMSDATLQLLDIERRSNVKTDIRDSVTQQNVARQLSFLQDIAGFTGKTVSTLLSEGLEDRRNIADLVGVTISKNQETNAKMINQILKETGNEKLRQTFLEVLRAGNVEAAIGQSETLQQMVARVPGYRQVLQEMVDLLDAGEMSTGEMMERLRSQAARVSGPAGEQARFGMTAAFGTAAGISPDIMTALGELTRFGTMREIPKAIEEGRKTRSDTGELARSVLETLDRFKIPLGGLSFAIIANTLAVMANTRALGGGLFGGIGRRLFGGRGPSRLGRGGRFAVAPGAIAGRAAGPASRLGRFGRGAGLAARGAGAAGRLAARVIPGLGTGLAGMAALTSFMGGDILGGLGHTAAAGLSLIPGIGTVGALGIEGLLAGRELGMFGGPGETAGPGAPPPPRTGGAEGAATGAEVTMGQLRRQTALLSNIEMLMRDSNKFSEQISLNTSRNLEKSVAEARRMSELSLDPTLFASAP